jgi:hypothetical protein
MSINPDAPDNPSQTNPDPLTGEAGAHPVATGIGAAAVGAAGLAASALIAGPVGVAAAVVGGAFIGGYAGKAAGELIDPTVEEAFWKDQHPKQPYIQQSAGPRVDDDDYFSAYRVGYVGYSLQNGKERSFEDAEAELRATYEGTGARVPWDQARVATRAAWDRIHTGEAHRTMPKQS